jgi:hypothetical protein
MARHKRQEVFPGRCASSMRRTGRRSRASAWITTRAAARATGRTARRGRGNPARSGHYEALARDDPGRPELLAARRRQDAYARFRKARLSWLGEDHPLYVEEFIGGLQADERMSREGW